MLVAPHGNLAEGLDEVTHLDGKRLLAKLRASRKVLDRIEAHLEPRVVRA